jgi:hypothetical protein
MQAAFVPLAPPTTRAADTRPLVPEIVIRQTYDPGTLSTQARTASRAPSNARRMSSRDGGSGRSDESGGGGGDEAGVGGVGDGALASDVACTGSLGGEDGVGEVSGASPPSASASVRALLRSSATPAAVAPPGARETPPAQDHTSSNGSHRKLETSTTIPTKARKATSGIGSDSSTGSGRDRELLPPVILIVHHHRGHPTSNPHLQARKLLQHYVKMTSVHFVG